MGFLLLPLPFLVVVKYLESVMVGSSTALEERRSTEGQEWEFPCWDCYGELREGKTRGGKEFGISREESQGEAQSLREGEHLAAL